MPSKKQYNLVQNDENDTRIPLHSEEAFHRGIVFHAKFIGSMEVPRPTSRMEIVAAMRRIRYEFKAKGIKKKKVTLEVSVDGLKVTLRKKKFPILQKKQHWLDESKLALMHHPIYRIFYVSHDSHDLKIFSYIARDGNNNSFRCNVFKSSKKSQAMRVVRTVGQAFEVCHKLSLNNPAGGDNNHHNNGSREDEDDRYDEEDNNDEFASLQHQPSPASVHKDISLLGDSVDESIMDQPCPQIRPPHHAITTTGDVVATSTPAGTGICPTPAIGQSPLISDQAMNGAELTALKHEIQLLRERLEQQSQQTRAAVAHARLLQDQLAAETAARVEAQARTHQLLVQNKELLEHIAALVSHLREHERTGGVPLASSQMSSLAGITQGASELGQYNQSAWDQQQPIASVYHQPMLDHHHRAYYNNPFMSSGYAGYQQPPRAYGGYVDELRYQAQLWDNVRLALGNSYVHQSQPPPSPSPYAQSAPNSPRQILNPGMGLPPSGRSRVSQIPTASPTPPASSSSTLPRATRLQQRSSAFQQQRSRSLDRNPKEVSFIKPLPPTCSSNNNNNNPRNNHHQVPKSPEPIARTLRIPQPRRIISKEEAVQTEPLILEPPIIKVVEEVNNNNNNFREEEKDEPNSGESEMDDELPELPRPTMRRRNSQ